MNLGVLPMKEYSTLPKSPELELHHQTQFRVRFRILMKAKERIVWNMLTHSRTQRRSSIVQTISTLFLIHLKVSDHMNQSLAISLYDWFSYILDSHINKNETYSKIFDENHIKYLHWLMTFSERGVSLPCLEKIINS